MASYKEPVYWHIRRLVVSHADAQDAAQEAFVRIFRNFQQYNEANSFKAWIFRIATNEALRLLGRQKGDMMLSLDEVTTDILGTKTDEHFDSSESHHACMNGRVTTNEDEVKSYASMKVLLIVGQVYHL